MTQNYDRLVRMLALIESALGIDEAVSIATATSATVGSAHSALREYPAHAAVLALTGKLCPEVGHKLGCALGDPKCVATVAFERFSTHQAPGRWERTRSRCVA